jgi:murein DD-endopeptidase MepM/ murein hydrolase activator NlpD
MAGKEAVVQSIPRNAALVILVALSFVFLPSIGLSEPYRVAQGDTLASIAKTHGTTVKVLQRTNHLQNANMIKPNQVLIIPESHSEVVSSGAASTAVSDGSTTAKASAPKTVRTESSHIVALRRGLEKGWVVTKNEGSGKIFVHESESGGYLRGLRYLIEESPSGETWTVHLPASNADGTHRYGKTVGVIEKPSDVTVGECGCE